MRKAVLGSLPRPVDDELSVDVVVAVHDPRRPVERAVRSLLAGGLPVTGPDAIRVSVVRHNLGVEEIARTVSSGVRDHVRWLHLQDGIASAAGPFNHGLAQAEAEYVMVMGSDDWVEPGALAHWHGVARRHHSDVVIAPQRHAAGAVVPTPPVRVGRRGALDAVRDRLFYRTAPLGLIARAEVSRLDLRFTPGLVTGEDQEFSARLWNGAARIDFPQRTGAYVVGDDSCQRVTQVRRPVSADTEFMVRAVTSDWFDALTVSARNALVTKFFRVHVFGIVHARDAAHPWTPADRDSLRKLTAQLLGRAPGARSLLSRADLELLEVIADVRGSAEALHAASVARRQFGRPATLLPARLSSMVDANAPLRFTVASGRMRTRDHLRGRVGSITGTASQDPPGSSFDR